MHRISALALSLALILGLSAGSYLPYFWLKRRVTRRQTPFTVRGRR